MTEINHPLHDLAMAIRFDLTSAQGKLTELLRQAGELEPVTTIACTICDYRPAQNMPSLAEHMHTQHHGPEPAHWAEPVEPVVAVVALSVSRARIPAGEEPS